MLRPGPHERLRPGAVPGRGYAGAVLRTTLATLAVVAAAALVVGVTSAATPAPAPAAPSLLKPATLKAKAPDDVQAYRDFVLDVAKSVGAAAKDTSASESAAIQKIDAALATP